MNYYKYLQTIEEKQDYKKLFDIVSDLVKNAINNIDLLKGKDKLYIDDNKNILFPEKINNNGLYLINFYWFANVAPHFVVVVSNGKKNNKLVTCSAYLKVSFDRSCFLLPEETKQNFLNELKEIENNIKTIDEI